MNYGIFQKVKEYTDKYHMLAPGDIVVAGVSGGADSVCLFLMLRRMAEEMGFRLIVVHVNHGIRKEAAEDAAYVKELCGREGVPFVLAEEDVKAYAEREHLSEEEAGRKARYRIFEEVLKKYELAGDGLNQRKAIGQGRIAVAHNANDRAETMLFHLFRGTGLTGAGGIRPVRGNVIRPLLCLQRGEIEEYLGEKGISFCIDRTNSEDTYTRNRIRNHIIPFAEKEVCHGAVAHMCGAADLFVEADDYIRRQAGKAYKNCMTESGRNKVVLDIGRLENEEPLIRKQVLLQCLEMITEGRKDITSVHMEEIGKLLLKQGNRQLSMPYGIKVRREYGHLILCCGDEKEKSDRKALPEIAVKLSDYPEHTLELEIPGLGIAEFTVFLRENIPFFIDKSKIISEKTYTKWLDYDRITKSLMFRTRKTGDYLTINKELSRKKLKDYMIEEKIPRNERENIYVLADGSHIIWVPGHRISEYYKITGETKHILKVQIRGGL